MPNQDRDAQGHIKGQAPDRWRTLLVVAISQLMLVLDSSIMNIAIPSAKIDLKISDANNSKISFSNEGAMQITLDSGLATYKYIIPAQA